MNAHQIQCMESLFAFSESVTKGKLSALDIAEVMRLAIREGHDMLMIQLTMATMALQMIADEREAEKHTTGGASGGEADEVSPAG